MAHVHRLNDHEPETGADRIAALIELVRPISELAKIALEQRNTPDEPPVAAPKDEAPVAETADVGV